MRILSKILFSVVLLLCTYDAFAIEIKFTLKTGVHALLPIPFKVNIDNVSTNNDTFSIKVYREVKDRKILLRSQLQKGENAALWTIPDITIPPRSKVDFIIEVERNEDIARALMDQKEST